MIEKIYDHHDKILVGINIFLPGEIEIQVCRSDFDPFAFWFEKYEGVAFKKSGSFQAQNWLQAYKKARILCMNSTIGNHIASKNPVTSA